MVDSPAVPPNAAKPAQNPAIPGEQSGRVVTLPDSMEVVARARRVEGEIVRQNPDGSTRVRTNEGNIDVQLRGRVPEAGTRVQVDVPAGSPPRQVVVRPAPEQGQQPSQPQPQQPPPVQTAPPQTQAPPARAVPLPPALPPAANTPPPVVTTPLPEQTSVRLLPVQPAQAQAIIQQTLAAITTLPTTATTTALTTNLTAQSAPANLVTQLVNTILPSTPIIAAPPVPALAFQPALSPPPIPSLSFLNQVAPSPGAIAPLLQTTAPPPSAPLSLLPAATPLSGTTTLSPIPPPTTPIPFLTANALLIPAVTTDFVPPLKAAAALDVLVTKISLSGVQLNAPGQAAPVLLPSFAAPPASPGLQTTGQASSLLQTITPLPQAQAPALTATVMGTAPQGQPLVMIPTPAPSMPGQPPAIPQTFLLQFPASNLPPGAQIDIMPKPGQIIPAPGAAAPTPLTPITPGTLLGGSRWPVLTEMMQTLQQAEPALAQALARALPSPASPRSIPAAALMFLAAAKAGDLSLWLGDKKIEALQRLGRSTLLSRLSGEGQQVARLSAEPLSNTDFRAVPLPMFWESEIQKVTLYFKRDGEDQQNQGDGEQTRFIFDLSLTRMGDMQIDGLMRGQRLDLIVRSQSPFSQGMQAHMKQLYHAAIDDVNLSGDLSFQGDPRQWVHVLQKDEHYAAQI